MDFNREFSKGGKVVDIYVSRRTNKGGFVWTINKRRLEKENLVYVPENKNWTGRAMKDFTRVVVRCADVVATVQERIFVEGLLSITIVPMGGKMVLIKVAEDEDFQALVKEWEDMFQQWFHSIRQREYLVESNKGELEVAVIDEIAMDKGGVGSVFAGEETVGLVGGGGDLRGNNLVVIEEVSIVLRGKKFPVTEKGVGTRRLMLELIIVMV
ncbi:hypothetical protein JHK84_043327 [Glycine max]|nr:hypothetical protein JHK86_043137 [Glycine max]KAG4957393.1 hypothetical protein JHK85_043773 [Glycine max]KAG5117214.1 hypothetical protein JHK84_043327 [Glycine max]